MVLGFPGGDRGIKGPLSRIYGVYGPYPGPGAHIRVPGPISRYTGHLSRIWALYPVYGPYTRYMGPIPGIGPPGALYRV